MMGYEITSTEGRRIYIKHNLRDELNGFIMLIKTIESELSGRIVQIDGDDIQYIIQGDPKEVVYRWESGCNIVAVTKQEADVAEVVDMLKSQFEKLNI